jgi:ABC-type multidrug transport system fused ATPase/permease subunit
LRGADAVRRREILGGLPRYILEILFILGMGLILLTSALSAGPGAGSHTVGLTALFVAAGFRILPSVTGLLGNVNSVRFGTHFLDVIHREAVATREHVESEPTVSSMPFQHELRVEDVSFRYPGAREDTLISVSLTIAHGCSTALVGGSGAGKTTLLDVILGLHDPLRGRVTVDGRDIAGSKRGWQKDIAYVPQDVYLLDATLAENIAFDREACEIDPGRLQHAIERAQLEELVMELPLGTKTPIGEKGSRLSGGQRQRVGIARALYLEPELLVLDEATSALDNETEHRINETIRALHGSITVLVVAHRLSTVRHADQVVFMKSGRVQSIGTFDELRAENAEFERLVTLGSLDLPQDAAG